MVGIIITLTILIGIQIFRPNIDLTSNNEVLLWYTNIIKKKRTYKKLF